MNYKSLLALNSRNQTKLEPNKHLCLTNQTYRVNPLKAANYTSDIYI